MFNRSTAQTPPPLPGPQQCLECPMCRTAINAESTVGVCASCPLYHVKGGCSIDLIACPQCGYHSLPQEHTRSRNHSMLHEHDPPQEQSFPQKHDPPREALDRLRTDSGSPNGEAGPSSGNGGPTTASTEWDGSAATCSGALRLSDVSAGTEARLLGFSGIDDDYLGRLTAYGLLPGVSIEVLQRFPAIIIGVYQAELALETELAEGIWVLPS